MKSFIFSCLSFGLLLTLNFSNTVQSVIAAEEIKFSIISPEGSSWTNIVRELNDELKKETKNEVSLKIYAGGKKGDESDVLRLMRSGNIQAAGLTGIGLGEIFPPARILELPFMWDSQNELNYVLSKMQDFYNKGFEGKDFKILGWAHPGFVNIFSKTAIRNQADMKGVKMWAWAGDPLVAAMFKSYEIGPVEVGLPDVLTSLQTGLLTAAYAPPIAALVLQWSTKIEYVTTDNLALSIGAFLITNKKWKEFKPEIQQKFLELSKKYTKKIEEVTIVDNKKALDYFAKEGKKFVNIEPIEKEKMVRVSKSVRKELIGKLFSKDELLMAMNARHEFRQNKLNELIAKKASEADIKNYKNLVSLSSEEITDLGGKVPTAEVKATPKTKAPKKT